MKKVIVPFTLFIALLFMANTASAKGVIFYSNGEKIEVIKTLPDNAVLNNEHVNLGVMYDQFSIFWIPMWNYGETKYVLINEKEDMYYDLEQEDLQVLKEDLSIDFPDKPSIGFWNKIGGKIIWVLVIVVAFCVWRFTRKEDDDANIPTQEVE